MYNICIYIYAPLRIFFQQGQTVTRQLHWIVKWTHGTIKASRHQRPHIHCQPEELQGGFWAWKSLRVKTKGGHLQRTFPIQSRSENNHAPLRIFFQQGQTVTRQLHWIVKWTHGTIKASRHQRPHIHCQHIFAIPVREETSCKTEDGP